TWERTHSRTHYHYWSGFGPHLLAYNDNLLLVSREDKNHSSFPLPRRATMGLAPNKNLRFHDTTKRETPQNKNLWWYVCKRGDKNRFSKNRSQVIALHSRRGQLTVGMAFDENTHEEDAISVSNRTQMREKNQRYFSIVRPTKPVFHGGCRQGY
ncbi:unnamed protein product, partial [Ectocarpus sp. 8 AP-2014]